MSVVVIVNTRSGGVIAGSESMHRLADLALSIQWTAAYGPDHTGLQAELASISSKIFCSRAHDAEAAVPRRAYSPLKMRIEIEVTAHCRSGSFPGLSRPPSPHPALG
jgi:hypothetical protein